MLMPGDVELYWRIRNDPYRCNGVKREEAMVYCIDLRRELESLDSRTQFILQAEAAGFTSDEMAKICMVSSRTMDRWLATYRSQRRFDA